MKTDKLQERNNIDLEPFYQALEDNPKLLEEAIETLLEMLNSESNSAKKMALLIKADFHDLYKEIVKLSNPDQDKGNTLSCCGT